MVQNKHDYFAQKDFAYPQIGQQSKWTLSWTSPTQNYIEEKKKIKNLCFNYARL